VESGEIVKNNRGLWVEIDCKNCVGKTVIKWAVFPTVK
jgi:hypothetical protein